MAIVRILKSSFSFSGIGYNNNRVQNGQGEVLITRNFGSLESTFHSHLDYINFMNQWCNKNKRIRKKQMHAIISWKGKTVSKQDLCRIGEEWLKQMGYANNPYIIYFHNNTANSHIHIITPRIDSKGMKINDSFEKQRAVSCLNQIVGISDNEILRNKVSNLLKCSFSTKYQFSELCTRSGLKAYVNDDSIKLKYNSSSITVSNDLLRFCINRYFNPIGKSRRKKIQALLYRYAPLYSPRELSGLLHAKFGIELIFYGKNENINGYTLIDNANKSVYKGSEILNVKAINQLFANPNYDQLSFSISLFLQEKMRAEPTADIDTANMWLKKFKVKIQGSKFISLETGNTVGECYTNILSKITSNTQINTIIRRYSPILSSERKLLARIFGFKPYQFEREVSEMRNIDVSFYKELILGFIQHGLDVKNKLAELGVTIYWGRSDFVIFDAAHQVIASGEHLGIEYDIMREACQYIQEVPISSLLDDNANDSYSETNIDTTNILSYNPSVSLSGSDARKRRKRH